MKLKNIILLAITMILTLAGCDNKESSNEVFDDDNVNEKGMPIVNEPITLNMLVGKGSHYSSIDWDDLLMWQEYEDMTNIHIEWEQAEGDSIAEKRRSEEHTSELQSRFDLVCRLLLEKK